MFLNQSVRNASRYSSKDKVAAAGVGAGVGALVGATVGVVGSVSGVGAGVGAAALGVGEKEATAGVDWPFSSLPQQATEPSILTPQVC